MRFEIVNDDACQICDTHAVKQQQQQQQQTQHGRPGCIVTVTQVGLRLRKRAKHRDLRVGLGIRAARSRRL